jgi:uncharacterized protein
MKIPEKVMKLLSDESSVKILSSVSNDGKLHSVAAGSIMAMGEDRLFVAEIFMNTTSKNIQANKNVAILIVKGTESYLINATALERFTEGEYFETMIKPMSEKGIPVKAVWTFEANEIFDQSATPNAGTKLD